MAQMCERCERRPATREGATHVKNQPVYHLCDPCYEELRPQLDEGAAEVLISELIPDRLPRIPGYEFAVFFRPARHIQCDLYDFIPLDSDRMGILIAEISIGGLTGAKAMKEVHDLFRREAPGQASPSRTMIQVNQSLSDRLPRGTFLTAVYGILSIRSGMLSVASAGHTPLVWTSPSRTPRLINTSGLALGIEFSGIFGRTLGEEVLSLGFGDMGILYTDGLVDARSPDGLELGDHELYLECAAARAGTAHQLLERVMNRVEGHRQSESQGDDYTLVAFRRSG
jgi:sigma-B regulation protein RsbU (phosphoserine phosphatase)